MLTDAEAKDAYLQLITVLLQTKLFWIVPQIQEEIARGKVTTKAIKDVTRNQTELFFGTYYNETNKGSSKEKVSISEAYSEKEQLGILVNALEEISVVNSIRREIFTSLKSLKQDIVSIELVAEEADIFFDSIQNVNIQQSDDSFRALERNIQEIKSEI